MRRTLSVFVALVLVAGAGIAIGYNTAEGKDEKKPAVKTKYTMKQIMVDGHKKGLLKKVATGKGTKEDKLKLLDMYISMYEFKPKKGSAESWTKRTGDALLAAAKLVVDDKANPAILKKATDCKPCHNLHKK